MKIVLIYSIITNRSFFCGTQKKTSNLISTWNIPVVKLILFHVTFMSFLELERFGSHKKLKKNQLSCALQKKETHMSL